ncbi:MAG: alpha/beta hydrolase [Firmicutes bacterium]|nr:alpha/beta hydrolase [Bacillota bacterium]
MAMYLNMDDGAQIFLRKWDQVRSPKGVLQLAHGMAEHSARYDSFARACNRRGFVVIGSDHRGHGKTADISGVLGYFAEQDGFDRVVDDLAQIQDWIQEEYPDLPTFLLGHSLGSFLTRRFLQKYGDMLDGAILMGSGGHPGFAIKLGKLIARLQMRSDPARPSKILDSMAFGLYNRGIEQAQTKFDWLTRDPQEVQKYMEDPYCGFVCSCSFFMDLFTGLDMIHNPAFIDQIPKDLPLLVVSGDGDPVGGYGRGVAEFVGQLRTLGLNKLEMILYPGARHELLHETNRDEVMKDIFRWLQEQVEG